ncbi:ThuA domain-containing protein [Fodinibius sediminis]|uniref:Trehalose utilisation n=1 Tax=Fodinibius sediminis TaxID=1214077 RepID=A0A521CTF5_9BACT|nr:ThuA domain-containing protein [Fodinibius sediminis]SMO62695.1 Trehalose utilisation [Fodinibius sediminis]
MTTVLLAFLYTCCQLAGGVAGGSTPAPGLDTVEQHERKHVVFLISKDENNYEAHRTIPEFAQELEEQHPYKTTVLRGEGERTAFHFPGLEVLEEADLLVIFARRVALTPGQMNRIKTYLKAGRPLLGIRTANHAFSVREEIEEGYEDWWAFVPDILGCKNRGYGPVAYGTDVSVVQEMQNHPIIRNLPELEWHSEGNVYKVAPLVDDHSEVLIRGTAEGNTEPVAWVRETASGSRVFYTSLGHPSDFETDTFLSLLTNAVQFLTDTE